MMEISQQQLLYIKRINKVVDYIETHLDGELSLQILSEVACFSPFHFHRIFSALLNETPNNYIIRRRIEKIANRLLIIGNQESIGYLAYQYGFKSIYSFSRAFRKFYGMSATEFQKKGRSEFSKIGKIESKKGENKVSFKKYFYTMDNLKQWLQMNTKVEVKAMPQLKLVHIRHKGTYSEIGIAFQKLLGWAGPRGLLQFPKAKMVGIYYDSPRVTEASKMQSSAAITVLGDPEVSGEVAKMTLPEGKFAVGYFEIKLEEFEQAWNSMYLWVPENNFELRDGYYYEIYHNDGTQHPEGKFFVEICIPIQ